MVNCSPLGTFGRFFASIYTKALCLIQEKGGCWHEAEKEMDDSSLCVGGLLLVCAGLLWYMVSHSLDFSVGRCLVAENGSYMFIDGNSPIVMSNRKDKEGMFAGLETGDKILLLHDGIQESYPGGTGAYWYMKLEDGTQADIPEQVMEELAELGWTIVANEADPNVVAPAPEAYAFDAQ